MSVPSKRDRLVEAASRRFHEQGLRASSIADVANDAAIPSGNVYHYFRTKDSMAMAVHQHWQRCIDHMLGEIEQAEPDPRGRLIAYFERTAGNASAYARAGCPLAALARDFRNGSPALQALAAEIFASQLKWLEQQYRANGLTGQEAAPRALAAVTAIQGGIGLSHALNSPAPLEAALDQARRGAEQLAITSQGN